MAQHLPSEILFHIFTNFLSSDQYLNSLMLVCRDWYQVTHYEMFWLATLKNLMKQQIFDCKYNEKLESLIDTLHSKQQSMVIRSLDIVKERKNYLSIIEKREKILIIDLKPFRKRREANNDIYGDSYKKKCVEFIRERRKRLVVLELAQLALEFEIDLVDPQLFEFKWNQIINQIEKNKYYDKRFIANLGVFNSSTSIFHIFIKQFQLYFSGGEGRDLDFLERVISFFLYDCELCISPYIEHIVKTGVFDSFLKDRENKVTLFDRFKNEVINSGKSSIPPHFLTILIKSTNLKDETHIEFIRKCCELFKSKKLLKFKENMVEPYMNEYFSAMVPNWMAIELYLKDMNIIECKSFDNYQFIDHIIHKTIDEKECTLTMIQYLKRASMEFGLKLDIPLPRSVTTTSNIEILKFLVENGADLNSPPPSSSTGVPLARIIYHCHISSRSEEILYMIEKGATLPPIDTVMPAVFYGSYTYANIFDYWFDEEKYLLPTLKILVEKFGARFSGASQVIHNLRMLYSKNCLASAFGLCELFVYLKKVTNFKDEDETATVLTFIYCEWERFVVKEDLDKREYFREFLEIGLGIQLQEYDEEEEED